MVRIRDQWADWLEDELDRLGIAGFKELARLLWAELPREDTPARTLARRIDDTET